MYFLPLLWGNVVYIFKNFSLSLMFYKVILNKVYFTWLVFHLLDHIFTCFWFKCLFLWDFNSQTFTKFFFFTFCFLLTVSGVDFSTSFLVYSNLCVCFSFMCELPSLVDESVSPSWDQNCRKAENTAVYNIFKVCHSRLFPTVFHNLFIVVILHIFNRCSAPTVLSCPSRKIFSWVQ